MGAVMSGRSDCATFLLREGALGRNPRKQPLHLRSARTNARTQARDTRCRGLRVEQASDRLPLFYANHEEPTGQIDGWLDAGAVWSCHCLSPPFGWLCSESVLLLLLDYCQRQMR